METSKTNLMIVNGYDKYMSLINHYKGFEKQSVIIGICKVVHISIIVKYKFRYLKEFVIDKLRLWFMAKHIPFNVLLNESSTWNDNESRCELRLDEYILNNYGYTVNELGNEVFRIIDEYESSERR